MSESDSLKANIAFHVSASPDLHIQININGYYIVIVYCQHLLSLDHCVFIYNVISILIALIY